MKRELELIEFCAWFKKHDALWGFPPDLIVGSYLREKSIEKKSIKNKNHEK